MSSVNNLRRVPVDAVLSLLNMPVTLRSNQKDRLFDTRCPHLDYHDRCCGVTGGEFRALCTRGYKRCFFHRSHTAQQVRKREMEGTA